MICLKLCWGFIEGRHASNHVIISLLGAVIYRDREGSKDSGRYLRVLHARSIRSKLALHPSQTMLQIFYVPIRRLANLYNY